VGAYKLGHFTYEPTWLFLYGTKLRYSEGSDNGWKGPCVAFYRVNVLVFDENVADPVFGRWYAYSFEFCVGRRVKPA